MNPKVKDAIQAAMDRCFLMNAICDRMVYVLRGQWFLGVFGDKFHHQVAHAYPGLADKLGDILLDEGENVTRGPISAQAQDYQSPAQLLAAYRDEVLTTRRVLGDAYYTAFDNAEAGVAAVLADILEDFQEDMVAPAICMAGLAAHYGENFAEFDSDAFFLLMDVAL